MRAHRGFTLIEMITVLVVTGVLAISVWRAVAPQINAARDAAGRAALVDYATIALTRMTREIALALPNSLRVNGGGTALEFLRTVSGGRYRATGDGSNNDVCAGADTDSLDLARQRDCFEVLGGMPNTAAIVAGTGGRAACRAGTIDCVAVFNTGQPGADAWAGDNLAGLATITSGAGGVALTFDRSDSGSTLPRGSPQQRFHVVDGAVSFVCDLGLGTLSRYADYGIAAAMSVPPAGTAQPLAVQVTGCVFRYTPGTATRAGLVSIELSVTGTNATNGGAETVTLLEQVAVSNSP